MLGFIRSAVIWLVLAPCAAFASTTLYDVHANNHVWDDGTGFGGNLGLDTGISLTAGDAFSVEVTNVTDTWNFCTSGSFTSCEVDADGRRIFADNSILGTYSSAGYSFAYGTLVGRVGTGDFFEIGTGGFSGTADTSGTLFLFHWDHNTNNGGSIQASVTTNPIPLPAGFPLLMGGLVVLGVLRRRGARS